MTGEQLAELRARLRADPQFREVPKSGGAVVIVGIDQTNTAKADMMTTRKIKNSGAFIADRRTGGVRPMAAEAWRRGDVVRTARPVAALTPAEHSA